MRSGAIALASVLDVKTKTLMGIMMMMVMMMMMNDQL